MMTMTMYFNNTTVTAAPTNIISDNKDCRIYGDRCHQQQQPPKLHQNRNHPNYGPRHYQHCDSQWPLSSSSSSSSSRRLPTAKKKKKNKNKKKTSSSPPPTSSVEELVIQRQRQLLLKKEKIRLTHDQKRLFLLPEEEEDVGLDAVECNDDDEPIPIDIDECNNNNNNNNNNSMHIVGDDCNFRFSDNINASPTSVIPRKITTGTKPKPVVDGQSQDQNRGNQRNTNNNTEGCITGIEQQQQQKQEQEVGILYPRDDKRSHVRFTPVLSVYRHYDDDDGDDDDGVSLAYSINDDDDDDDNSNDDDKKNGNETSTSTTLMMGKNSSSSFRRSMARRCWYSKDELRTFRDERKSTIRMLKKVNFVTDLLDKSIYTLRGLESYHSIAINETIHKRRKKVWESVLNEQCRQESLSSSSRGDNSNSGDNYQGSKDVDNLRIISGMASRWARNRAYEIAENDDIEAARVYRQHDNCTGDHLLNPIIVCDDNDNDNDGGGEDNVIMTTAAATTTTTTTTNICTVASLHESFSVMDIDDCGDNGSGNVDSALSYWADSSWTRKLMGENSIMK